VGSETTEATIDRARKTLPEHRTDADRAIVELAHERDAVRARLAAALVHLRALVAADGPCAQRDHHGQCQTHYLSSPCPVAVAREWLAREGGAE
jgi:hypothetical protein